MAQGHCRHSVAIGHQARRKRAQFTSTTRKNRVAVVQVRWNIDSAQLETFSSVWVPCVRPPGTLANEKPLSKVGRMLPNRHLPMPFSSPRIFRTTRPINTNWTRQPTISLCV